MSDEDLDLVESERLFEALGRRSTAVLVVLAGGDNVPESKPLHVWYSGGAAECAGLAHAAAAMLIRDVLASTSTGDA